MVPHSLLRSISLSYVCRIKVCISIYRGYNEACLCSLLFVCAQVCVCEWMSHASPSNATATLMKYIISTYIHVSINTLWYLRQDTLKNERIIASFSNSPLLWERIVEQHLHTYVRTRVSHRIEQTHTYIWLLHTMHSSRRVLAKAHALLFLLTLSIENASYSYFYQDNFAPYTLLYVLKKYKNGYSYALLANSCSLDINSLIATQATTHLSRQPKYKRRMKIMKISRKKAE